MDSYMRYTHAIHHGTQDRFHDLIKEADKRRLLQHLQLDQPPQRRHLRLALSNLFSPVRSRVLRARSSTTPSPYADRTNPPIGEPTGID